MKIKEGRTEKLEWYAEKHLNINYGIAEVGYLAVYEDGKYILVSQIESEGSVVADYISTENWNHMSATKTGDCVIKATFGGKNYYMRGNVSLPEYGFYSEKEAKLHLLKNIPMTKQR